MFKLGQVFIAEYPPEAAEWCNEGNLYHIEEIECDENGTRRFKVVANPEPEPPTPEEIQQRLSDAVQAALDGFARTRLYDGIMSACSYYGSSNPKFAREAEYCLQLRDDTWAACYAILDDVKAGKRGIPTAEELIAELPVASAEWPAEAEVEE